MVKMQSVLGVKADTVAATFIAMMEVFQIIYVFPLILLDFRNKIECICEYLM